MALNTAGVIKVDSFDEPLSTEAISQLEKLLPEFVQKQRWYRAKAKQIRTLTVEDVIPLKATGSYATVVRIEYTDSEHDSYLLPLTLGEPDVDSSQVVAALQSGDTGKRVLYNALASDEFRAFLLQAIACEETWPGAQGALLAGRTQAFDRACDEAAPDLESKVSRAEQSNSSIIYGDKYILKVFRKLETGVNPDIEIGTFLTAHKFAHTPAVLGQIQYQTHAGDEMYAGLLQGFVANEGDAWKFTLDELAGYFKRALEAGEALKLDTYHPFELMSEALPEAAQTVIGSFLDSARLLGQRTAEMHAALASSDSDPEFAPEKFDGEYAKLLHGEMLHEANRAFGLLREKSSTLAGEAGASTTKLFEREQDVRSRFDGLAERTIEAVRIRHHGDFHLGQVLYTGSDFIIIDFEGEPARPLAARRLKTLAMRDVAGMIRSFSYAAYAALFGQVEGVRTDESSRERVEGWAAFWSACVSAVYLKAYFEGAKGLPFASKEAAEQKLLFDAFVLQKALYEVAYELNNRPDWVQIPLRGILTLLS